MENFNYVASILSEDNNGIHYNYAWQLKQTLESSIICTELEETESFSTVYCIAFTAGLVRR